MKSIAVFNREPVEGTYVPKLDDSFGEHTKEWAKNVKVIITSQMPGVVYMDTYGVDADGNQEIHRSIEKEYVIEAESEDALSNQTHWYDFILKFFREEKPVYMRFVNVELQGHVEFYVKTVDRE